MRSHKRVCSRALLSVMLVSLCIASAAEEPKAASPEPAPPDPAAVRALVAKSFVVPNTGGIRMILIRPGTFVMGSPPDEPGRGDDETQHTVTISRPFYIAETETTQDQYLPIMWPDFQPILLDRGRYGHSAPEIHQGGPFLTIDGGRRDTRRRAMDGLTWEDGMTFGATITERERAAGRLPEGYVYRLPTEAEWEYACRAGTKGPFNVDEKNIRLFCVHGRKGQRTFEELFHSRPQPYDEPLDVKGPRTPNAWGLYDMHGNLNEWCYDWYGPYPKGPVTDPTGPAAAVLPGRRVARGGCFVSGQGAEYLPDIEGFMHRYVRSASRNHFRYDHQMRINGARLVLAPEIKQATDAARDGDPAR